jgi:hypothetical protein
MNKKVLRNNDAERWYAGCELERVCDL